MYRIIPSGSRPAARMCRQIHSSCISCRAHSKEIIDTRETQGKLKDIKKDLWQNQFVLKHFEIPGKFQKFFTGRMRKREVNRLDRQLNGTPQTDELLRVGPRKMITDEPLQKKKMEMLRSQVLRILEAHLSSEHLPVLVSFNLKSVVCCYKVTSRGKHTDGSRPHEIRRIIEESSAYLGAIVNQELAKGAGKKIGVPRSVRVRFSNGTATSKLIERIQAEMQQQADKKA
ncbi:hypothetical protein IWW36_004786 [Coemansia brasiliensis]|uniref:Uncharacterized protein n=1 Tax=Coemansia brasiliensis TaxID=2650707 RepID=A0A9W8I517_9FUNG|nr:hypothetical protein IWW36_004786 [Coemansia brasiliensis]